MPQKLNEVICTVCGYPDGDHAAYGDWCPSKSDDQLFSSKDKFVAQWPKVQFSGELIAGLALMVDRELMDCTFDQMVEVLRSVPAAIFECSTCQSRKGLTYCRICHEWFCMKPCLTDHACAQIDGPATDPLRG